MPICEACGQEMNTTRSCGVTTIEIEGVEYELIPYGQETRYGQGRYFRQPTAASDTRCHDCGVLVGGFHHPGCDVGECPRCHGQLLTCDCLGDQEGYDEQEEYREEGDENLVWEIEELFGEASDPNRIIYKGQEVIRGDEFPTHGSKRLKVVFESVGSDWLQAILLGSRADLPIEINGQRGTSFELWADTAPPEVYVGCEPREEQVVVQNAWDTGSGSTNFGMGAAGMIVEELPNGRRYRCNDAYPDDDFDDLVFRIERITE